MNGVCAIVQSANSTGDERDQIVDGPKTTSYTREIDVQRIDRTAAKLQNNLNDFHDGER